MKPIPPQPARLKGILWGSFSVTATFSAFILPAFIVSSSTHQSQDPWGQTLLFGEYIPWVITTIILFGALYHSGYRIIASNHDLQLITSFTKWIGATILIIAIIEILTHL